MKCYCKMSMYVRTLYSKCVTSFLQSVKFDRNFRNYSQAKLRLKMNEAFLRYDEGSDEFKVSFRYVNSDLKVDRQFNFNRSVNEPISSFLQRIDRNIMDYTRKKFKRKKKHVDVIEDNLPNKIINFVKNDTVLDGDLTCKSILENTADIKLIIFGTEYKLKQNTPCVTKIQLPSCILVDFPTYPTKFETTHVDKAKSTFEWFKSKKNGNKWTQVGEGYIYVPSMSDIGCKLKIVCTPRNEEEVGMVIEIVSNNEVEAGPGPCPFDTRHVFTKNKLSGKSFRVVSYNILAGIYSETDFSKDVLYPYCPQYVLSMDYRKLLILKELMGYNADIICLQEVDPAVFERDLTSSLSTLNYSGVYNSKCDTGEGIAIFYNQERFDKLSSNHSILSQSTNLDEFKTTWSKIQNENTKQTFLNRRTIIQVVALRSKENSEILVVGNTHLYFRPGADHIRLLQAYCGLTYLQKIAKETKEQNPECTVSILFCGDFNSCPENAVYQLITQNYIPEDHPDWKSYPNEHVENVSLSHELNISSACGTPEYTNYTATFSGCLDYIFYQSDNLNVEQVIPMPSKEELSLHKGLPSVVFPSDHISLCVDLKWSK